MITERELQELVDFESEEGTVLSLYLNVDPTQRSKDEYKLTLRGLLKEVADKASPQDVAEIERYFDFEYDWQGKGVALFSCLQDDFWQAYPLAVPVENQVFVSQKPYIKPLTDLLDMYDRFGVVVVNREGARLLLFRQGELEKTDGTLGEEVKRIKHGGGSAAGRRGGLTARAGRYEEGVAQRNLREVAELTVKFCERGRCSRLILAGTGETVAQLQGMLPKELKENVVGSFAIDMTASEVEILDRSLEIIQRVDRQREKELVERVVTAAAKGEMGAIGLADTLAAVQEGRAHILVVAEGYKAPGYRCVNCSYTSVQELTECPFCGKVMERIEDAVNSIVHRAIDLGVQVEAVKDNPDLEKAGNIGALLRY